MKDNRFIFGVVLLVLGVVFLFDQLNIIPGFNISVWRVIGIVWPLILVYLGGKLLMERKVTGGLIVVSLGLMFLGSNLFDVSVFSVFWPLIIIAIALSLILNPQENQFNNSSEVSTSSTIKEDIVFWGLDRKVKSKSFKGGKLNCVFGGGSLDLRETKIAKDGANLEVNCVFGGAEIIVPEDMNVKTNGTGVFGGWDPKFKSSSTGPALEITGAAVFGGVEIKNK